MTKTEQLIEKLINNLQQHIDEADYIKYEEFNGLISFKNTFAVFSVKLSPDEYKHFEDCEAICFLYNHTFSKTFHQIDLSVNVSISVIRTFDHTLYLTCLLDNFTAYKNNKKKS